MYKCMLIDVIGTLSCFDGSAQAQDSQRLNKSA